MVYGFVTQAGGTVTIDSSSAKGTAIGLYLPRAAPEPGEPPVAAEMTAGTQPLRILLVDDDADVRESAQAMLEELGHAVTAADSGPAGLALLRETAEFDLLLVDFAMSAMTGVQFAEHAMTLRPGLPVLLMTGYVESAARQSWSERDYRMLMKPFNSAELAVALSSFVLRAGEVEMREQRG